MKSIFITFIFLLFSASSFANNIEKQQELIAFQLGTDKETLDSVEGSVGKVFNQMCKSIIDCNKLSELIESCSDELYPNICVTTYLYKTAVFWKFATTLKTV